MDNDRRLSSLECGEGEKLERVVRSPTNLQYKYNYFLFFLGVFKDNVIVIV